MSNEQINPGHYGHPGQRKPVIIFARTRASPAPRPVVALLADFACRLDTLKNEFSDPIDKAALREAVQLMHDVALSHDDAGSYGVYAIEPLAADGLSNPAHEEVAW